MSVKLYYQLLIHDKDGKLIRKTRLRRSKSYVLAYLKHVQNAAMHAYGVAAAAVQAVDVDNNTWTLYQTMQNVFSLLAANLDGTYGLVVGTGTTAPTNADYKLETKIAHGTGAGQLSHGAHSLVGAAVVGGNVDMIVSRPFYNGSGGTVTVREIGGYVKSDNSLSAAKIFCIIRDVLGTPVDVPDTKTLTVQYTMRTTV